jgi:hypothetical protein
MENKKIRKIGSGRKKVEDKKLQVTVYIKKSTIQKKGGLDNLKTKIISSIETGTI